MSSRELIFSACKSDFRVDYYRGSGPGGQNRNKRDNSCRITHKVTGLAACAEDSKSQSTNKQNAFRKLCAKLVEHYVPTENKARGVTGKQTRTYNESTDRVVDHVTGEKFSYKQTIGSGDMSVIIESRAKKMAGDL